MHEAPLALVFIVARWLLVELGAPPVVLKIVGAILLMLFLVSVLAKFNAFGPSLHW